MILEQIQTAGDRNFGYLIADSESRLAAVVDPSGASEKFAARLERHRLRLQWIIGTHDHTDHTSGIDDLRGQCGGKSVLHRLASYPADHHLDDGDVLELGALRLQIIWTPGHTPDSICIVAPGCVFTGDTLFVGKVGGTDFGESARRQYASFHDKLLKLQDDTKVYPGHDVGVRPSSTIGDEKKQNPFLLCPDYESFVDLKRNWAAFKAEHGIA